jgi:SAM-dependent methyltransferase
VHRVTEDTAPACRICGNTEGNRIHHAREMMFGTREVFPYLECRRCECLQLVAPPPDPSKYYPPGYYSFQGRGKWIERAARRERARYAVLHRGLLGKYLARTLPSPALESLGRLRLQRSTRILDVGCGAGSLLFDLASAGFHRLTGVDPYIGEDIVEPPVTILRRSVEEVDGTWDVIMMHHAFEHMEDPLRSMRATARRLAPAGVCIIRIPTVPSDAWERYGVDWVQLDAPRHVFIHSRVSMELLARASGLRLEKVVSDSTAFQFWGSEQYRMDIPLHAENSYKVNPRQSPFTAERIAEFRRAALDANARGRGDQAAFYLVPQARPAGCLDG